MNGKIFGNSLVKFGFVAFALALGLVACGDGGSTNGPSNNHEGANVSSVESEENLPSCTESREGFVNFINGTKEGFVCKNRRWDHYDMIADAEENLPGCTGSREGLSAYLYEENRELNCVEGSWDVVGEVANSSSSEKSGSSSSREKDGSSSSVAPNSSSSVIPGTDPGSSSSSMKAAWAYLNPNIDYGEFTDERDGQVYKTVKIGTQTWMAENLNYAYTGVKYNYSSYTSDSTSWCYDNKASNCDKYGFSVLPAGYRYNGSNFNGGNFYGEGSYAYMWSASDYNRSYACYQVFRYHYAGVGQDGDKDHGYSVRCLKD